MSQPPLFAKPRQKIASFEEINKFAVLSNDFNPLHVDKAFAAKTPFGAVIAHGPMSTGLLLTSIADGLSPESLKGAVITLRLKQPVRENDVVTTGNAPQAAAGEYRIWVQNQKSEPVIEGTIKLGGKPA